MSKFNKGFTLIELLIVISIVGILSGTVLLNLSGVRDTAQGTVQKFSITTQIAELERQKIKSVSAEVRAKIQEVQDSLKQIEEADKVLKISTSTSRQKQLATQKKQESTTKLNEQRGELDSLSKREKNVIDTKGGGNPFSLGFITQLPTLKFDYKIDSETTELTLKSGDRFGYSVSITPDGDTLVVGAYRDGTGGVSRGAVYVFTEKDSNGNFISPKKIDSGTTGLTLNDSDLFGWSASITPDGDTLVVGAIYDAGIGASYVGAVYVFTEKDSDGNFINPKKIDSKTTGLTLRTNASFGYSVSITPDGDTLVVGAYENSVGAVYIFTEKDSDGNFINPKKISSKTEGLTLMNNDRFGRSVSITPNGDTLVVGAYRDGTGGVSGGAVYVFTKKDSDGNFINPKKISSETTGLTLMNNDRFGTSVSITPDGNTLVVGAHQDGTGGVSRGAVYVFTKKDSDGNFINPKKIDSKTTGLTLRINASFGYSVSITEYGNTLVVGEIGAVYIFKNK